MVVGVSIGAYAAGLLPPDDARLLQGAPVHGGRLGDLGDGRAPRTSTGWAAFASAMPFTVRADDRRRPGARRPSRARPASSPRTRSSSSRPSAAASTGSSRSAATSARFLTAFYAFRIIFRVFCGEPCPRRGSSSRDTSPTPSRENPLTRRDRRTPTSASPAPSTTSPSATRPMAIGDGGARLRVDLRRLRPDPGPRRRDRQVPGADRSTTRRCHEQSTSRSPPPGPGSAVGGALAVLGIAAAYYLYVVAPAAPPAALIAAPRARPHASWSTSGTSTSSTTRSSTGR